MPRGKQITVSWRQLSPHPGLPAGFHAQHTSCCHPPVLLQKRQPRSEMELLGHLNCIQQARGLQQWNAALPRQPTAHASVYQSVLSFSSYSIWLQPPTTQTRALHPPPTERGQHSHFGTASEAADSSCAGTRRETLGFFFKFHENHSLCQMNPDFYWLLSISASLLPQFKLQNCHAAQAEGGGQTLAPLVLYYRTWSSCRHYKHVRCLRDVSPRTRPRRAASTRASFSLPLAGAPSLPSGCRHCQGLAGDHRSPDSKRLWGKASKMHLPRALLEELLWNWA